MSDDPASGGTAEEGDPPEPADDPGHDPEPADDPESTDDPGHDPEPADDPDHDPEPADDPGHGPDPLRRTVLVGSGSLLVALVVAVLFGLFVSRFADRQAVVLYVAIKTLVTTFNGVLLVVLTATYVDIYRDLPNRFTLSLVLVSLALLLYALTSNPIVHFLFRLLGVQGGGLGPFTFVPDLFAGFAVLVLLYQSYN